MIRKLKSFYRKYFWSCEKYAKYIGVKIGENCKIATIYFGSEPYLIEIGNHVQITQDVRFSSHGGARVLREEYPECDFFGKIKIGNNVYIGNSSIILPGVVVGDNVLIGAGSIVTKSIPDGMIVAGNPARIVGETKDFVEKIKHYDVGSKGMSYEKKKKYLLSLSDEKFIKKGLLKKQ